MSFLRSVGCFLAVFVLAVLIVPEGSSQPVTGRDSAINNALSGMSQHLDLADDESLDSLLLNFLFAKQLVERLRNSQDPSELQRKRSYWKQCAFNAVSCFGKK